MKFYYLVILLFSINSFSQTINGTFSDNEHTTVYTANILIKEANNPKSIKEYIIARNGGFTINLKKDYQEILIEVVANGYFKETYIIENPQKDKT